MNLLARIACPFLAVAAAWQHWIWPALLCLVAWVFLSTRHYEQEIQELIAVEEEEEE